MEQEQGKSIADYEYMELRVGKCGKEYLSEPDHDLLTCFYGKWKDCTCVDCLPF
jgi:hypothetical protein